MLPGISLILFRHLVLSLCLQIEGNCSALLLQTLDENEKPMSHTEGTGEISPKVAKMLPASVFKGKVDNKEVAFLMLFDMQYFFEFYV